MASHVFTEAEEGKLTSFRIAELAFRPVEGNFDVSHLKEIHRRIFQDLPHHSPGDYRPEVPESKDWMKQRKLSTVDGAFFVAYSHMGENEQSRLATVLEGAKPKQLKDLKVDEFTQAMAILYAELDYIHPFKEGNSRTLREFTKQLATESGYEIDWERFSKNEAGRDILYIARDLSVNKLAIPNIKHEDSLRKVSYTMHRLEGNRDMANLLQDVVQPARAAAFEKKPKVTALKSYPELASAYKLMDAADKQFKSTYSNQPAAYKKAMDTVKKTVQESLNKGKLPAVKTKEKDIDR